jgi:hypothetical protein
MTAPLFFFTTAPCSNNERYISYPTIWDLLVVTLTVKECVQVWTLSPNRISSFLHSGISLHGDKRQALLAVSIPWADPPIAPFWPSHMERFKAGWMVRPNFQPIFFKPLVLVLRGHPLKLRCFPQPSGSLRSILWFAAVFRQPRILFSHQSILFLRSFPCLGAITFLCNRIVCQITPTVDY